MKFITAIAFLIVAAVAAVTNAQSPAFTDCSGGTGELTVAILSLSPYPLCVGAMLCITITGSLTNPIIPPVSLTIAGKYLGRVVYTDHYDLCAVLAASGQPCPIAITVTSITICVPIKANAPTGIPIALTISATNGNGNSLFCQVATITAQTCP